MDRGDKGRIEDLIRRTRLRAQAFEPPAEEEEPPAPTLNLAAPKDTEAPAFAAGQVLAGRYRIVRFLARGGMGEVFEAEDLELRERIALKTIRSEIASEPGSIDRFKREVQLARRVTHRNVCRLFDLGYHTSENGVTTTFLTMELLSGDTVSQRLARHGKFAANEALPIAMQLAEGLAAAHRAGIIHRDFKSANVILVPEGKDVRPVITDFGLARGSAAGDHFAAAVTGTGAIAGTPAYMAPEQVRGGAITQATDLYSLGVVLFEMVTGCWPFTGNTPLTIAAKRLSEPPPSPRQSVPDLDPAWESTILRCLEIDPHDRFAGAMDVARSLAGKAVAPAKRVQLKRKRIAVAFAALTVLAVLAGFVRMQSRVWNENASWYPAHFDSFERQGVGPQYSVASGNWSVENGALTGKGNGAVNIDVLQRFPGDVKIEFDAAALPGGGKKEFAVFLVKDRKDPLNRYYFGFGCDWQVTEIDRNNVEMVQSLSPTIEENRTYHVMVLRSQNRLEISVDRKLIAVYTDPIPLNPNEYAGVRLGTYDGAVRIDNLKIFQKRVPEMLEATVPGDRLYDRGDFDAAMQEYMRVFRDQEGKPIAGEALLKAGLCLMQKGQYSEAQKFFTRAAGSEANDYYKGLARMNFGRALSAAGKTEEAFQHLAGLAKEARQPEERYRIAVELLLLSSKFGAFQQIVQREECLRFVSDSFPEFQLLSELAAYRLCINGLDEAKHKRRLIEFLRNHPRPGKPRYGAEELLGSIHVREGDPESALSVYRQMEKEYAKINVRFSLRGIFGQAAALALAGRAEESAATAARILNVPGDPELSARLYAESRIVASEADGNIAEAIRNQEQLRQTPYDELDSAILYLRSGNTRKAEAVLNDLRSNSMPEIAALASLFSGKASAAEISEDSRIPYEFRRLYLVLYDALQKQAPEAVDLNLWRVEDLEQVFLSPLLCRALLVSRPALFGATLISWKLSGCNSSPS